MENDQISGKAKGGVATAAKMTPEERTARSMKGIAAKREISGLPKVTHPGELVLGDKTISCAVLDNGKRVISETGLTIALLGSRSGASIKLKKKHLESGAPLPVFLAPNNLKPFIDEVLEGGALLPLQYKEGNRVITGYDATILPVVCNIWLKAREAKALQKQQLDKAQQAEILMRGLAHVGIITLVDEATGFQKDRARDELAKILEAFVAKELQPWVKTFPPEFYEHLFRLRGLPFPGDGVKRPQYFGHLTNDIIYRRLAPGVWKEIKEQAEKTEKERLKHKLFQKLTPEIGHPKLRDLITSVTTVMKLSDQWDDFKHKLDRVQPAYNETMLLPFDLKDDSGKGI